VVPWTAPTFTDNCAGGTLTTTKAPGSTFNKGTTTVTYTATDAVGNTATCSFNVNVVDNTPPVIAGCPANITVNANASCQAVVTWTAPTVSDNCSGTTLVVDKPSGSVFEAGTTRVTYTASTISGQFTTCSFDVIVIDNLPPEVAAIGTITATVGPDCRTHVNWSVPSVLDCNEFEVESTHQPGDEFNFGTTNVTYSLTDAFGNSSNYTFEVVVENQHPPIISNCPDDITIEADEHGFAAVNWADPTAAVVCGQLSFSSSHSSGERFPIGTTQVVYTASDDLKNESQCTFKITVTPAKIVVEIAKVVSPDGDGINDYLKIENIEKYKENGIEIVDRWGGTIFKANGYDNDKVAWKGTNPSGGLVPTGTYFFAISIRYGTESVQRTGFIELIR
jgi:gliding motility-associated-like protein